MNVSGLLALARRHIFAVAIVLLAVAAIAYDFKRTPPAYTDTAIVSLEPESANSQLYNDSLITICQIIVMRMAGAQGQDQLQRAGVVGSDFTVVLINSSNADDPRYYHPLLTVSATNRDPGATRLEFNRGMHVLTENLAALQSGDRTPAIDQVKAHVLSNSGPVPQRGSRVRAYAALLFLALVAVFLTASFLDRRPIRLRHTIQRWGGRSDGYSLR